MRNLNTDLTIIKIELAQLGMYEGIYNIMLAIWWLIIV
jgi:hypothetical protein